MLAVPDADTTSRMLLLSVFAFCALMKKVYVTLADRTCPAQTVQTQGASTVQSVLVYSWSETGPHKTDDWFSGIVGLICVKSIGCTAIPASPNIVTDEPSAESRFTLVCSQTSNVLSTPAKGLLCTALRTVKQGTTTLSGASPSATPAILPLRGTTIAGAISIKPPAPMMLATAGSRAYGGLTKASESA